MINFILTLILIGITFFVLNLFPFFKDWTNGIRGDINEKTNNVVEEYDRVKGEIEGISETVTDAKDKVNNTLDTVGRVVDTAGNMLDKVDNVLGTSEDDTPIDEANDEVIEDQTGPLVAGENDAIDDQTASEGSTPQ